LSVALTFLAIIAILTFFTSAYAAAVLTPGSWPYVFIPNTYKCPYLVTMRVKSLPQETLATFFITRVGSFQTVVSCLPTIYKSSR